MHRSLLVSTIDQLEPLVAHHIEQWQDMIARHCEYRIHTFIAQCTSDDL
jgi:hypothetical protein